MIPIAKGLDVERRVRWRPRRGRSFAIESIVTSRGRLIGPTFGTRSSTFPFLFFLWRPAKSPSSSLVDNSLEGLRSSYNSGGSEDGSAILQPSANTRASSQICRGL
ncbi:hypothetical protein PAXINDRAFT_173148, partial [Paxillus involutus ATCC 200175]